jgi:hypothetical protein
MIIHKFHDCEARRALLAKLRTMAANATSRDYRERARRIQALANQTTFPQIKNELLQVAIEYERLAAQAESRRTEPGAPIKLSR